MTTSAAGDEGTCAVCGETFADPRMTAECNWCDRRFHLNQRNDVEAKDCGAVWIDEQYLALQFACNDCLAHDGPASGAHPPAPASPPAPKRAASSRARRYRRRS
jgi:hypothetical protein